MLHKNRVYPIGALLLFWLLLPALVFAQLTIKVVAVPANTPQGANIYIAGTFNNWNPSDPTKILTSLGGGQYQIVLNPPAGTVEFKFTRGGWPTVEGDANGNQLPNRTTTYNGQPKTVELTILSWEDLPSGTTAAANVTLLDDDFYMPQLNKNRKIWIYLPPDYQTSTKHYPVLYMQDAQNLFDDYTSFSGEWEVDESLNEMFTQGDYGCIVVGIENGGADRLDEYSPWVNSEYNEGGDGAAYVEFMVNTLKPYVDEHYRTLPGRNTTGVMGSSMGGLISMYADSRTRAACSAARACASSMPPPRWPTACRRPSPAPDRAGSIGHQRLRPFAPSGPCPTGDQRCTTTGTAPSASCSRRW